MGLSICIVEMAADVSCVDFGAGFVSMLSGRCYCALSECCGKCDDEAPKPISDVAIRSLLMGGNYRVII